MGLGHEQYRVGYQVGPKIIGGTRHYTGTRHLREAEEVPGGVAKPNDVRNSVFYASGFDEAAVVQQERDRCAL
jgi:hypothetical protein